MTDRAIALIDIAALRHNLSKVRKLAPYAKVMAMVKGNAYGHGMVTIAKHLLDVDYFAVEDLDSAKALRHSGIIQPIVLLSGFSSEAELNELLELRIEPVIFNERQAALVSEVKKPIRLWIKVDTGMHRYGFTPEQSVEAWHRLVNLSHIESITWMTHFACAAEERNAHVLEQIDLFETLTAETGEERSAANSAAILQYPEAHYDIVRPGIMLYGVSPLEYGNAKRDGLMPVMTLKSTVVALNHLSVGDTLGYGALWEARKISKIAVVSIGYGDGYPQMTPEGTPVLINGKEVPIVGRVSMDSLTVDVSHLKDVNLNDEVTLWGEGLPIEKIAAHMDCSPYGLLTGVSLRVRRIVVGLDEE